MVKVWSAVGIMRLPRCWKNYLKEKIFFWSWWNHSKLLVRLSIVINCSLIVWKSDRRSFYGFNWNSDTVYSFDRIENRLSKIIFNRWLTFLQVHNSSDLLLDAGRHSWHLTTGCMVSLKVPAGHDECDFCFWFLFSSVFSTFCFLLDALPITTPYIYLLDRHKKVTNT